MIKLAMVTTGDWVARIITAGEPGIGLRDESNTHKCLKIGRSDGLAHRHFVYTKDRGLHGGIYGRPASTRATSTVDMLKHGLDVKGIINPGMILSGPPRFVFYKDLTCTTSILGWYFEVPRGAYRALNMRVGEDRRLTFNEEAATYASGSVDMLFTQHVDMEEPTIVRSVTEMLVNDESVGLATVLPAGISKLSVRLGPSIGLTLEDGKGDSGIII
jgi:hypothetical protein